MVPSRLVITIFLSLLSLLSAFLLFQVQPVIGKYILPWFGGSPGVWTTCMLFFQVTLFFGYAYAHGLSKLPRKAQWITHGVLVVVALAMLPISPSESWKPSGQEEPAGRILLLLLGSVALPYFVLASTSPLVQVWFTRAHGPAGNPWRLYALSNVGSLAALLTYPPYFERQFSLQEQTLFWSIGFGAFAVLSLVLNWWDRRNVPVVEVDVGSEKSESNSRWWQRVLWLFLSALGSALLLATTNHVTQDVAVIPFLWVAPLSLYLLSFIICFEHSRWYKPWIWATLAVPMLIIAALHNHIPDAWLNDSPFFKWVLQHFDAKGEPADVLANNFIAQLIICLSAMFLAMMVCHGELTRLKPAMGRLTEFYLCLSGGGALGGLAVSLVAPNVFNTYQEWPWCLLIATVVSMLALVRAGLKWKAFQNWPRMVKWAGALAFCLALPLILGGIRFYFIRKEIPKAGLGESVSQLGTDASSYWGFQQAERLYRVRNFYGALSVQDSHDEEEGGSFRQLHHGGIIHGSQWMVDKWRTQPLSYYGPGSGINKALVSVKEHSNVHVGVVGMGTATIAAYGRKGHRYRFYEINPDIIHIAKNYFKYISDLIERGGKVDAVLGDARLSLERELRDGKKQHFDVLLLDAFSGDAVPVHLLTREAFEIYRRHMKSDGIIAVHVTNRYLNLAPMIERTVHSLGYKTTRIVGAAKDPFEYTDYVLVTNNQSFLDNTPRAAKGEDSPDDAKVEMWTDQQHNLMDIVEK